MTVSSRVDDRQLARSALASKRVLDICVSVAGLIALSPLLAFVAAAIRLEDGAPAIYRQTRVGLGGATFQIAKFRSMTLSQERGSPEITVEGDKRITRVGGFIRRYKIDELPQLWNVLIGEMSLVGPRPETPLLLQDYTFAQRSALLALRPGITDWASLLLRNESELLAAAPNPTSYYREVLLPLKHRLWERYRCEAGLLTDFRILAATVCAVAAPNATNPLISRAARDAFNSRDRAASRP
jgi:lipopolysaccharide/colanic/teichoic acid biosynthesis glycosyltransferase